MGCCPNLVISLGSELMAKKLKRIRADELLVSNNLCESRNQAKTLILAGQVRMGTERIDKSSRLLPENAQLQVVESLKYVGRGGLKMENFLDESGFKVDDMHILDIGASTGDSPIASSKKEPPMPLVSMWGMGNYTIVFELMTELTITRKNQHS